jgi:anti-anti-sigma regulatory factor
MAQATIVGSGWDFEVDRGPDWLFVRPRRLSEVDGNLPGSAANFAEQVWTLLEQQFTHRLVLEFSEIDRLNSELIGQLVWLHKRIHTHDGLMRVCGLTEAHEDVLHACRLGGHFPRYETREDAVMGHAHPRQPR